MKQDQRPLSALRENTANPRLIRDKKFKRLLESILVFPQMLNEARPIIIDIDGTILGGNQRFRVLKELASMRQNTLLARLSTLKDYNEHRSEEERTALVKYWMRWHDAPTANVIVADDLSDQQKRELIIKDNTQAGEWDFDMLANEWDASDLPEWGLDVWQLKDHNAEEKETAPEENQKKIICPECGHEIIIEE